MSSGGVNQATTGRTQYDRPRVDSSQQTRSTQDTRSPSGDPHVATPAQPGICTQDDISGMQQGMNTQRHDTTPKSMDFPDKTPSQQTPPETSQLPGNPPKPDGPKPDDVFEFPKIPLPKIPVPKDP
ncbi:MAG TPA: hypothetical protein V6D23_12060, partial [Candidatus Obscuribacterales bacterium]